MSDGRAVRTVGRHERVDGREEIVKLFTVIGVFVKFLTYFNKADTDRLDFGTTFHTTDLTRLLQNSLIEAQ